MDFTFVPIQNGTGTFDVPYIEDARADFAPYYDIRNKTVQAAQLEVTNELSKFGAGVLNFEPGKFLFGKKERYGFNVRFSYGGGTGIIRVAGLPIKNQATEKKIKRVQIQALMNVRDWLKAAVTNRVFSPGSDVLIPFMLVDETPGQEKTVAEYIATMKQLPHFNPHPERAIMLGPGR